MATGGFCLANQCAIHISDANRGSVCPPKCIATAADPLCNRTGKLCSDRNPTRGDMADARPFKLPPSAGDRMQAVSRPANRLLQVLPAAEFQSLRPHLETVELAKGTVLPEAGAPIQYVYLPHSGVVSILVSLSEGQTVEVAMVGCDSLVGGSTAFDDGPALADATVVVPGTASVLKAEELRAAADQSGTLRRLLARHEQALLV